MPIVGADDHGVRHDGQPQPSHVPDPRHCLLEAAWGPGQEIVQFGHVAMQRRRELRGTRICQPSSHSTVGEHPAIGLNLDSPETKAPRIGHQFHDVRPDGHLAPREDHGIRGSACPPQTLLRLVGAQVREPAPLVALDTEAASVVAGEAELDVHPLG